MAHKMDYEPENPYRADSPLSYAVEVRKENSVPDQDVQVQEQFEITPLIVARKQTTVSTTHTTG